MVKRNSLGGAFNDGKTRWTYPPTAPPKDIDLSELSDKELYQYALRFAKVTVLENELLHRLERFLELEGII